MAKLIRNARQAHDFKGKKDESTAVGGAFVAGTVRKYSPVCSLYRL
jgi:hypothetical protein